MPLEDPRTANTDISPPRDPWPLFKEWFALAEKYEPNDPNAMALSTVGSDLVPSVRMVLMKSWNEEGLVFFTNNDSRKGQQLKERPHASVCFHWKSLRRQVRLEGGISPIAETEADRYFHTRPRGSQIGAWASLQSQPLSSRAYLEAQVKAFEEKFDGQTVPKPPNWGGYKLAPLRFEFWQDREFRLHDRILYLRHSLDHSWSNERLYP